MTFWNNIVNTALLGTDKKPLTARELATPDGATYLAEVWDRIQSQTQLDNEEKFLQMAALALNYRKCGIMPMKNESLEVTTGPSEEKPYCNAATLTVFNEIITEGNQSLLKLWLQACNKKGEIVPPEIAPVLLNKSVTNKSLRPLVQISCGKRGEWLASMNPDWKYSAELSPDDAWQNGTGEQRKTALRALRETDPSMARGLLVQTWNDENANTRAELLRQLEVNIGDDDKSWLESLLSDKSTRVKDEALRLLKFVPSSDILKQYWQIITGAVAFKKGKSFLGLNSKMVFEVNAPVIKDDVIFKTGIDQLSKDKKLSDDDYILQQLIQETPPVWWEEYMGLSPEAIIPYFQKDDKHRKFLDSILLAAIKFKDLKWVPLLAGITSKFDADCLPLLPISEREQLIVKNYATNDATRNFVETMDEEWSSDVAKAALTYMACNPYAYNKGFYKEHIHQLPVKIVGDLKSFSPDVQVMNTYAKNMWENEYIDLITQLLGIKQSIYKAFI